MNQTIETMKSIPYTAITAALLFCSTCPPASAEPLNGDYDINFGESFSIYDLSGFYEEDVDSISMSYTIHSDTYGRLTGSGTFSADEMGVSMSGNMQLAGTVKSSGGVVRMDLTCQLNGTFSYGGYNGIVEGNIKIKSELDTTASALSGTVSGSVSVSVPGLGKEKQSIPSTPFYMEVPESVDGEWELLLNDIQLDLNNGLTGTAQIDIDGGKTLNFIVSGKYAPKTDLTKIQLAPAAGTSAKTISLSATDSAGQLLIQKLKADLLGQKLNFTAPAGN